MASTGYPEERLVFVEGEVQKTLPETAPEHLALLRLDTDWYQSTLHELVHLYPRLASRGALFHARIRNGTNIPTVNTICPTHLP